MKKTGPVKDRLDGDLTKHEKLQVRQALWTYLKQNDPDITKSKFDGFFCEQLLPHLQKLSPIWDTMRPELFVTSYNVINTVYHTVRNYFQNHESLKKNIESYALEMLSSEDPDEVPPQPKQRGTRSYDNSSQNLGAKRVAQNPASHQPPAKHQKRKEAPQPAP